jgi:hypothetical protein
MKIETLYRDILKKAWNITFKHRVFWFLGLFAAPLIGIGEYKIIAHSFGSFSEDWLLVKWYPIVNTDIFQMETLRYLGNQLIIDPISVFILFTVLAVMALVIFFVVWLAVVAQGSLIDAVDQAGAKRIASPKLSQFIATGIERFWPMLGVQVFVKLIISLLLFILSLPILAIAIGSNAVSAGAFYYVAIIIFIPLTVILAFISKYAINYIIIEKEHLADAIQKSYRLFLDNWLVSLEMSIILLTISILAGLALAVFGSFLILPIGLLIYFLASIGILPLVKVVVILTFLALIILGIFFAAILSTFQYSSWVLLFKKLHASEGKVASKLTRLLSFKRK